ncbi:Bro-N domain-containing protein [Enterobacter cloacae complex sp. IR5459]|uniref:BRO-N domain-containing protein n=1 Tax=Enterobacter cloacae complex sp. IR5459 TaxID=3412376 RepID=UPI003B9FE156
MNKNLLQLCYEGEGGESYIRSINEKGQFYVSLADVLKTLSIENRKMDGKSPKSLLPVIKAVIQTLDPDEIKNIPMIENGQATSEAFLTEPGLYRVLAQDTSSAGKKFQRWLFHKVLPSIREFGQFPPPLKKEQSEISAFAASLQQTVNALVMEIAKREELESRVNDVELKVNSLESLRDLSQFRSVPQRLMELSLEVMSIDELWHWCEKLRSERGAEKIKCPSGIGVNTMYPLALVDEAIAIYQKNVEARSRGSNI